MDYSKATIIGRLARDPSFKMTQSGMAICEITVAVNTFFRGEKTASFFDVVAFGKTAEIVNEKTRKGDEVLVDGELKIDRFETKAGEKREKIVISASTVRFSFHRDGQQQAVQQQGQYQQQQPAPQRQQYQQPYAPQAQYGTTPAPAPEQQPPAQSDGVNGLPF